MFGKKKEEARKPYHEEIGLPEDKAKEIQRDIEHLDVDAVYDKLTDADFIERIFPHLTKEEKFKIFVFGNIMRKWGYNECEVKNELK